MLQKIVTVALVLTGLVLAGLGVASGTVWRPSDTVTLSSGEHDSATLLMTEPGVLGLVDDDVTIGATGPEGTTVVLAIGRASDVQGWIGTDPAVVVTGATDWETLSVDGPVPVETAEPSDPAATDPAAPADPAVPADPATPADPAVPEEEAPVVSPDPAGSDMWQVEASGEGAAELEWSASSSDQILLAATVGETTQAPVVTLTWPREVTTPWVVPGIALGSVLVLVGLVLGYLWFVAGPRRDARRAAASSSPRAGRGSSSSTTGGGSPSTGAGRDADLAAAGASGLTRRELREQAERAHLQQEADAQQTTTKPRRTWPWTGAIPTVTPPGDARPKTAAVPAVPEPEAHRPGWLSEGTASASGSGWRQAWGVRPGAAPDPADPAAPTSALPLPTAERDPAGPAPRVLDARPAGDPRVLPPARPETTAREPWPVPDPGRIHGPRPVQRPEPARGAAPVRGAAPGQGTDPAQGATPARWAPPSQGTPPAQGTPPSQGTPPAQGTPPRGGGVRRRPPVQPDRTPADDHEEDR